MRTSSDATDAVRFRAMGTQVSLLGPPSPRWAKATRAVQRRFGSEERRFSRFLTHSELSRVNAAAGSWTDVSPAFEDVADLAIGAAARTEGRFDPSVLDAILACGYDRDFDEVIAGARGALRPPRPCGRWNEIERRPGRILLPAGVSLDFGGIAKGWTVDRAAEDAVAAGLPWALVDAGGDLRLNGDAPELEVAVEDPERPPTELVRLRLRTGALATSTTAKRAWGPGLHHLIDPATGAPATGRVIQATVWAPTCAEAEVAAKDALLRDDAEASAQPGVLLTADGQVTVSVEEAA